MEPIDLVPSGYRFLPTAEELGYRFLPTAKELVCYLVRWIITGTLLPGCAVEFAEVYGTEPWNLLGNNRQEGYFFTELKPVNSRGPRVKRKAGNGYWHGNRKVTLAEFIVGGCKVSVQRNYLSFRIVEGQREKNSGWTMSEYAMCYSGGIFDRRVLCHVKKSSQMHFEILKEIETCLMSDDTIPPTSSTAVTWVAEYEASLRSVLTTTLRAAL